MIVVVALYFFYEWQRKYTLISKDDNNIIGIIESEKGLFNPIIDKCISDGLLEELDDPDCDDTENNQYKMLNVDDTTCDCSSNDDNCYKGHNLHE